MTLEPFENDVVELVESVPRSDAAAADSEKSPWPPGTKAIVVQVPLGPPGRRVVEIVGPNTAALDRLTVRLSQMRVIEPDPFGEGAGH